MLAPASILAPTDRPQFPRWVPLVAVGGAIGGGALGLVVQSAAVAAVGALCASAAVVGWADVTLRRIPNVACASLLLLAIVAVAVVRPSPAASVAVGSAVASLPFLLLHVMEPAWVGFGDVKLLAAIGAVLGLMSPFAGLVAAWLAGVAALVARPFVPRSWRSSVPYGFWLSLMAVPVAVWLGVVA